MFIIDIFLCVYSRIMVFCDGHDFIMLLALQLYSTKLDTGYLIQTKLCAYVLNITDTGKCDHFFTLH